MPSLLAFLAPHHTKLETAVILFLVVITAPAILTFVSPASAQVLGLSIVFLFGSFGLLPLVAHEEVV